MSKKIEIVLNIVTFILFILALVFLGISIFGNPDSNIYLIIALLSSIIGNFLNFIRNKSNKK